MMIVDAKDRTSIVTIVDAKDLATAKDRASIVTIVEKTLQVV